MDRDQPLTPSGRLFLQPEFDQVINAVMLLEHPIDVDAVKAEVASSFLLKHPRFCSLTVRGSCGRLYWRRTQVDLDSHLIVRRQPLSDDPSVSDEEAVNDFIADLTVSSPLPTDKPLWEIHLLMAHNTMVFRLHHALGDGISLMSMLLSCCRRIDDPTRSPEISVAPSSEPRSRRSLWTLLMVVRYTLIYVLEFLMRILWLRDKTTAVSGGDGVELWPRKLATARFLLDDMKTIKLAVANATINDVLFGVISRGLSRYLDMRSPKALSEGVRITGLSMVNLRPQRVVQDKSELIISGNKFGMLLLPVYYHKAGSDVMEYLKRAKDMIDKKKLSLEGPFSYAIGYLAMSLFGPKFAYLCNYRIICNTTFTISNVVGPKEGITAAGNPVKQMRVTSSSLPHALIMHMLSYNGVAELQILVAKEIIPDPKVLAKCFEDALLEMKEAAIRS